jgi:hypothetical protein
MTNISDAIPNAELEKQVTPIAPNGVDPASPIEEPKPKKKRARKAKAKAEPQPEPKPTPETDPLGEPGEVGPDPFDPEKLRIDPLSAESLAERVITEGQVSVRKPRAQEFFRVHPDQAFRTSVATIILKDQMGETYLVDPSLVQGLAHEINFATLLTCLSVGGDVFLWALPTPKDERRPNRWHTTAREGAKLALDAWTRLSANVAGGYYHTYTGAANLAPVTWPKGLTLRDYIAFGFGQDGIIRDRNHPVLKRLRGER